MFKFRQACHDAQWHANAFHSAYSCRALSFVSMTSGRLSAYCHTGTQLDIYTHTCRACCALTACNVLQVHAAFHNITAMVGAGVLGTPLKISARLLTSFDEGSRVLYLLACDSLQL